MFRSPNHPIKNILGSPNKEKRQQNKALWAPIDLFRCTSVVVVVCAIAPPHLHHQQGTNTSTTHHHHHRRRAISPKLMLPFFRHYFSCLFLFQIVAGSFILLAPLLAKRYKTYCHYTMGNVFCAGERWDWFGPNKNGELRAKTFAKNEGAEHPAIHSHTFAHMGGGMEARRRRCGSHDTTTTTRSEIKNKKGGKLYDV